MLRLARKSAANVEAKTRSDLDACECKRASSGGKPDVFPKGSILGSLSSIAAHLPDPGAGSSCNARQHVGLDMMLNDGKEQI